MWSLRKKMMNLYGSVCLVVPVCAVKAAVKGSSCKKNVLKSEINVFIRNVSFVQKPAN